MLLSRQAIGPLISGRDDYLIIITLTPGREGLHTPYMQDGVNLWRSEEHAGQYLDRADTIPHRCEGEGALLEWIPTRPARVTSALTTWTATGNGASWLYWPVATKAPLRER
jgi:hypothetical protein